MSFQLGNSRIGEKSWYKTPRSAKGRCDDDSWCLLSFVKMHEISKRRRRVSKTEVGAYRCDSEPFLLI